MARMGGYMRVSRRGGRDEDAWLTIPIQRDAITGWIARNDHELVDLRQDIDQSGGTMDRPNLEALVDAIERGEIDGLVVGKLDRFAREVLGGARVINRIERAGGWFVAAGDQIIIGPEGRDDRGADDGARLQLHILLAVADHFLRANRAQWRETRRRTIERGSVWGPHVPLGYQRTEGNRLEPDPVTAPIVREVFERRAAGQGDGTICRWLTELGVRTGRGGDPTHRYVAAMLKRRTYLGESRSGEFVNVEAHEAIVPRELFDRAQLTRPRRSPALHRLEQPVLTGLLRCHGCRGTMTSAVTIKGGVKARTYRCRTTYANGRCEAPATILERDLLQRVDEVFWEILDGDVVSTVTSRDVDRSQLQAEMDKAYNSLVTYRDDPEILAANIEPRIYVQGLKVRQERYDLAKAAFDATAPPGPGMDAESLRQVWPELSREERGRFYTLAIGCIVVQRSGERYTPAEERLSLGSRTRLILLEDLPDDLPRSGRTGDRLRGFPPLDADGLPWVALFHE